MPRTSSNHTLLVGLVMMSAALLATMALLGFALNKVNSVSARLEQTTTASCRIQARGLKAQKYLTRSLDGIHIILAFPPSPDTKRREAAIPRKLLKHELKVVASLNTNLAAYVAITAKQPPGRTCP